MTEDHASAATLADQADEILLARLRQATLGEYDVFGVLGKGGMATVYLAHDLSLDRKVAIKVMAPELVHGSDMVERFRREARTAANLSHANIIPIYAVRDTGGLNFCVQKLIKGTPLDAIIRELGQLPFSMAQAILLQVGDALDYAHRQGVIHRDIKPANILIDDEGWAIVTDFGIAKVQDSDSLTMTGMAVGTPTYMSPEQCNGLPLTGAADQYSLGIVAYEMLIGRPPFSGATLMAILNSHFNETPTALTDLRRDCPPELERAVLRMLAKDPDQRWPTLQAASQALGAVPLAHDDPVRSHLMTLARTGTTHRIVSQVQTPRSPIPLGKPGAGATLSNAAPGLSSLADNHGIATLPAGQSRGTKWPLMVGGGLAALLATGYIVSQFGSPRTATAPALKPGTVDSVAAPERVTLPDSTNATASLQTGGTKLPATALPSSPAAAGPQPTVAATNKPPIVVPPPSVGAAGATTVVGAGTGTGSGAGTPPTSSPPVAPPVAASATADAPSPVDARPDVVAAIQAFTRALSASDLAAARRIYPAMPGDQADGLTALWKDGGTMTPRWNVSDVSVDGTVATARVQGVNVVTPKRGQASNVPVSLLARLERRGADWRLVSLLNQ